MSTWIEVRDTLSNEDAESFRIFCWDNTNKFPHVLSAHDPEQFQTVCDAFEASREVVAIESLPEPEAEVIAPPTKALIHGVEFDGTDMLSSIRLNNPQNPDAYKEWHETQNIEDWLAALNAKHREDGMPEIPYTTRQMAIKIHWGDRVGYQPSPNQQPNKDGVINLSHKVTEKIGSRRALHASRKSSSALEGNHAEGYNISDSRFWREDWVIKQGTRTVDDIEYQTVERVLDDKLTPNFGFKWCSISDAQTKKNYFSYSTVKTQATERKRAIKIPSGCEDFITGTFIGELHNGGYSEPFQCLLRVLDTKGNQKHNPEGQAVVNRETCRLRVASICVSEGQAWRQQQQSVDKTTRIWLDIKHGTNWSPLHVIGNASFISMAAVFQVQDWDSSVSRQKSMLRQYGRHIISLLRSTSDHIEINKAIRTFDKFPLQYKDGVLYALRHGSSPLPLMHRVLDTHVPLVIMQMDYKATQLLVGFQELKIKAEEWLTVNHTKWLEIDTPDVSMKKKHSAKYTLVSDVRFCAKQTVRWGNPAIGGHAVEEKFMIEQSHGMVGLIEDPKTFLNVKYDLASTLVEEEFNHCWDKLEKSTQRGLIESRISSMQLDKISHLFNPRGLGLTNPDGTPVQQWFDLVTRFWSRVSNGKINLQYNVEPLHI